MTGTDPFHEGEIEVQRMVGVQDTAKKIGNLINDEITRHAYDFIHEQVAIWIGIEDRDNQPWAFPLFGSPGFIKPKENGFLEIEIGDEGSIIPDWDELLRPGVAIGCLLIEFSSRRRLRINGVIDTTRDQQLNIRVQQSYPNCPKYVRRRVVKSMPDHPRCKPMSCGEILTQELMDIIKQSDTAFVSSIGPNGADVSHRGGEPGFIQCGTSNNIIVPDYRGNNMFNTLGNFRFNPKAGLLITDFADNRLVQLTGIVNIHINGESTNIKTGGTHRYWEMQVHEWKHFKLDKNFRWGRSIGINRRINSDQ